MAGCVASDMAGGVVSDMAGGFAVGFVVDNFNPFSA